MALVCDLLINSLPPLDSLWGGLGGGWKSIDLGSEELSTSSILSVILLYSIANQMTTLPPVSWLGKLWSGWGGGLVCVVTMEDLTCLFLDFWALSAMASENRFFFFTPMEGMKPDSNNVTNPEAAGTKKQSLRTYEGRHRSGKQEDRWFPFWLQDGWQDPSHWARFPDLRNTVSKESLMTRKCPK